MMTTKEATRQGAPMSRTTAILDSKGHPQYAGSGAVNQQGNLKVYRCNTCGAEVVWCESKRTGKHYLANVHRGYLDQRFYVGASVHHCPTVDSERVAELQAKVASWDEVIAETRDMWDNDDGSHAHIYRSTIKTAKRHRSEAQAELDAELAKGEPR